jgi:hypothetical protein
MNHDAELDQLHAQSAAIGAAQAPLLIAFVLALMAVVGLVISSPFLGIIGWFGGLLVGIYAISRGAAAIELPALAKYPAMIATFVPGFCALATGGVWWLSRNAASANAAAIERVARSARLAAQRPAAGPAAAARPMPSTPPQPAPTSAAAATPSPIPEKALPVIRGVLDQPADANAKIEVGVPHRPEGMSDADWALVANATGPVARGAGHFLVMYRMDNGDNWLFVNEDVREQSGLTRDGLHRKALQNLMAIVKRPGQLRQVENPPYMGFLLDGEHESSLVLVDEVWNAVLRNDCPNGAVVAIPARDLCMFCDADSPEGIIALREMCAKFAGQRGFVSDRLLVYTAMGWSVLR